MQKVKSFSRRSIVVLLALAMVFSMTVVTFAARATGGSNEQDARWTGPVDSATAPKDAPVPKIGITGDAPAKEKDAYGHNHNRGNAPEPRYTGPVYPGTGETKDAPPKISVAGPATSSPVNPYGHNHNRSTGAEPRYTGPVYQSK